MSGFGSQPFGSSPYGIGTPLTVAEPGGKVLRDPKTGDQFGSRLIDPITKDYVIDEHGRALGMPDAMHLVQVAIGNRRGRSAMRELGLDLDDIQVLDPSVERLAQQRMETALAHLTSRKIIEIVSVTPMPLHPGAAKLRLVFRDVATGVDHPLEI